MALVVILLSGCGGSDGGDGDADQNPPVSSETSSDAVPTKTSVCEDKTGDGGPMDLVSASIRTGDDVVVTAVLAAPIPRNDTVDVGVLVQSRDWDTIRLLVGKWVDGRAAEQYVYNMDPERQHQLPASGLQVDGNTVTMTFPASTVDDLGDGWTWGAHTGAESRYTDASGTTVDACPGPPGGMKRQPF